MKALAPLLLLAGCAVTYRIFASMSEDEAVMTRAKMEWRSVFNHEMQHCAGYAHREVFR